MNFKTIHIGEMIKKRCDEVGIEISRLCHFFQLEEENLEMMYSSTSIDTELLLKWSKILDYDFFRIYTQHLIFYAPAASSVGERVETSLPRFRKNIYTQEVIDFILELVKTGKKTKQQIITEYNIPKTTLYKWISKHQK